MIMPNPVLQKYIAESGFCSRREAERLIREGRVFINGKKAQLGARVGEEDIVKIDDKKIGLQGLAKEKIYIKLNKPMDYTSTTRKFDGEKNVFDLVKIKARLFIVGRLDKDSRGLMLLTNDGDLAQRLTHPRYEHEKQYEVRVNGHLGRVNEVVKGIKAGVEIGEGDGVARPKNIKYLNSDKFIVILAEGKKRQIRRMFAAVDCEVIDLVRVKIGNLELGNLKEGEWKYLSKEEISKLKS